MKQQHVSQCVRSGNEDALEHSPGIMNASAVDDALSDMLLHHKMFNVGGPMNLFCINHALLMEFT